MSFYLGVPVGATVGWLGSLVGVELPANFIVNYDFSGSFDSRQSDDFDHTSYTSISDEVVLQSGGYTDVSDLGVVTYQDNEYTLSLYESPCIDALTDATPDSVGTVELSLSDAQDILSVTTGNYSTTSESAGDSRVMPVCTDWNVDGYDGSISGDDYKYLYRSSESDSIGDNISSYTHSHGTGTSYTVQHGHTVSGTLGRSYSTQESYPNASQETITYNSSPLSLGVIYITRVW